MSISATSVSQTTPLTNGRKRTAHPLFRQTRSVALAAVLLLLFLFDQEFQQAFQHFFISIAPYGVQFSREMGELWVTFGFAALVSLGGRNYRRKIVVMLVAVLLAGMFTNIVKPCLGRVRPKYTENSANFQPFQTPNASMPSGHSTIAMANAYMMAQIFPQDRIAFYAFGTLTGISRIQKNAHYSSDVFAGFLVGFFVSRHVLRFFKRKNYWREEEPSFVPADGTSPSIVRGLLAAFRIP